MFQSKKILSFVGARSGSKGIKNKNIIDLAGRPLLDWTIRASLGSRYIDRTIVSTDGEHIAEIARKAGADVPFLRPAELATDESLLDGAIQHCTDWLRDKENVTYDYIVLLQPTSPLRTSGHIDEAIRYYFDHKKSDEDMLISVTPAPKKVGWLLQKDNSGYVAFSLEIAKGIHRRQELPQLYLSNGFIYFGPEEIMKKIGDAEKMIPYITDENISIDIDLPDDLKKAAALISQYNHGGVKCS